jgi:hypothetical protein
MMFFKALPIVSDNPGLCFTAWSYSNFPYNIVFKKEERLPEGSLSSLCLVNTASAVSVNN